MLAVATIPSMYVPVGKKLGRSEKTGLVCTGSEKKRALVYTRSEKTARVM
jgi:hypothetical protein